MTKDLRTLRSKIEEVMKEFPQDKIDETIVLHIVQHIVASEKKALLKMVRKKVIGAKMSWGRTNIPNATAIGTRLRKVQLAKLKEMGEE